MGKARNLQFVGQPHYSSCIHDVARCETHIWQCFDKSAPRQKPRYPIFLLLSTFFLFIARPCMNPIRPYVRSSDVSFNWFTTKTMCTCYELNRLTTDKNNDLPNFPQKHIHFYNKKNYSYKKIYILCRNIPFLVIQTLYLRHLKPLLL